MTAPVVPRLNTVVYGGFTVGGTSDYHLHGVTVSETNYESLTVSFQVFVNHDTRSTFVGYCTALEAAYRKPNGALVVTMNGTNWINLSHSGNTGMNARPSLRKVGGAASNNSRIYECSVTVMMPADESGKNGRHSASYTMAHDGAEIYTLSVSAVYTAISTSSALTQAQAQFPTYAASITSAVGGAWDEAAGVAYSPDDENKVCTCRAVYRQLVSAQSQSGTNDTTLQGVWSEVTTDRAGIGADPGGTDPLVQITVRLFANVRSTVSTSLHEVYVNTVRPHLIALARSYSGYGEVTAIAERPGLRPQNNSISSHMVFLAPQGSYLIRSDTNIAYVHRMSHFYEPVLDGGSYSRDRHNQPGFKGAAVATTILAMGSLLTDSMAGGAFSTHDAAITMLQQAGYKVTERRQPTTKPIEFDGMGTTGKLRIIAASRVTLMEFADVKGGELRSRARRGAGAWIDQED